MNVEIKWKIIVILKQIWNEASGGIGLLGGREYEQPIQHVQHIPNNYQLIDANNSTGGPRKNCTANGNCAPKCFAEKGNRGLPGISGLAGPKGDPGFPGSEGMKTENSQFKVKQKIVRN